MKQQTKKYMVLVVVFLFIGAGFIFLSMDYNTIQSAINGLTTSLLCFAVAVLILFLGNIKNIINDGNAR